ncbi:Beta-2-glycoprotein 1 APC inhibitor Activated protein C-binding protein Apolipoprotein H [Channa argus]|uniref:Beta-2-glycoprotein 1 n=1 Tax=Channa argus TaxID=215402 RepID=A0A6G1PP22_CHAAH|nr:Beta-2-glycoprotein 1 APC inhibitor Activated protein C-binding protein Apolipoprotein H [Channa argus]
MDCALLLLSLWALTRAVSPQFSGRTCPWPLPPSDNSVDRLLSPTHSFSALLEVRCKPGFTLPNGLDATIRRCQGDRQWSGDEPICADVYCQPPPEVEQGYVVAVQKTEYEVGFDIHFLCKKNFLLDGPQKITCQLNGSWSASPPHCRARCLIPAERSRVLIGGVKRWPFDVTDAMVPHGENVTFFCKHPRKQCSFTTTQTCFDGKLQPPSCYLEPTWLQYKLFPHRLVSEIEACEPGDVE